MAFPGYPLPTNKTNATLSDDDHAPHHNDLAAAVNALQAELTAAKVVVRARRHRNGEFLAANATQNLFRANAVGTNLEQTAGITFVPHPTNGYFVVSVPGTYKISAHYGISTSVNPSSCINIAANGEGHRIPVAEASGVLTGEITKYLYTGATILFSFSNNSPTSRVCSIARVEIAKVTPS